MTLPSVAMRVLTIGSAQSPQTGLGLLLRHSFARATRKFCCAVGLPKRNSEKSVARACALGAASAVTADKLGDFKELADEGPPVFDDDIF